MGEKVYRVRTWAGGWGVFDDGTKEAVEPFRTQGDAVAHAKELARHSGRGAQILVYATDDKLVSEFFYQHDERASLRGDDAIASIAASAPATVKREHERRR
jgi:hypothetical protein